RRGRPRRDRARRRGDPRRGDAPVVDVSARARDGRVLGRDRRPARARGAGDDRASEGSSMRRTLAVEMAAGLTLPLASCGLSTSTVSEPSFAHELRIPKLAPSTVENGVRTFELTAGAGETTFPGHAQPTRTWGFNGDFLGPTLRAKRGERVAFEITNELDE